MPLAVSRTRFEASKRSKLQVLFWKALPGLMPPQAISRSSTKARPSLYLIAGFFYLLQTEVDPTWNANKSPGLRQ
jgi:hypothetical protein